MINQHVLHQRINQLKEAAKSAGIRLTPQRLAIFKILAGSEEHPGAEEIHRKLSRSFPMISLDTVYRTLRLLADLGLISTVDPWREHARFDANLDQHHHFTCLSCGAVRDFTNAELDALSFPPQALDLGRAESLHVEVRGICTDCLKQENSDPKSRQTKHKQPKTRQGA
ncbi:MAG: transcriptional repressor [Candidatus Syntrophosphaera sp.]|nr:transcriptional repressor [Candidatus Syntrophosphaera sp.]